MIDPVILDFVIPVIGKNLRIAFDLRLTLLTIRRQGRP